MVSIQRTISAGKLLDIKSLHSNSTTIIPWISKVMSTHNDGCHSGSSRAFVHVVCLEWLVSINERARIRDASEMI